MDLAESSNRKAAGGERVRARKRLRFIINSPTISECSSAASKMTAVSRESSNSLFRLPRQLTEERSGPERARDLEEKLLHLWYHGLGGPPANLDTLLSNIEESKYIIQYHIHNACNNGLVDCTLLKVLSKDVLKTHSFFNIYL